MVGMAWTGAPCPGFRHSHAPGQGGRDGHHATVLPPQSRILAYIIITSIIAIIITLTINLITIVIAIFTTMTILICIRGWPP